MNSVVIVILEIMPRIIFHLKFILDNPDIKILVCIVNNLLMVTTAHYQQYLCRLDATPRKMPRQQLPV
jgi:hypothetical protein